MSEESQAKVEKLESIKTFRFGGGERRKSLGFWRIPCKIAGRKVMLETDVVEADIPCLLSKAALKRCGTQDSKKYADTTSFVVTAVTTNLVVTVLLL